jgi:hypothetical protein
MHLLPDDVLSGCGALAGTERAICLPRSAGGMRDPADDQVLTARHSPARPSAAQRTWRDAIDFGPSSRQNELGLHFGCAPPSGGKFVSTSCRSHRAADRGVDKDPGAIPEVAKANGYGHAEDKIGHAEDKIGPYQARRGRALDTGIEKRAHLAYKQDGRFSSERSDMAPTPPE